MYLFTRNSALLFLVNNKGADQPVMRKTKKNYKVRQACRRADPENSNGGECVPPRGSRQLQRGGGGGGGGWGVGGGGGGAG